MGTSISHDANDGDDDELQRFSNWGGALSGDVRLLLPNIMGPTILSIYRPGRGELADGTLVDGPWAASALKVNTEGATPARIE